MLSTKNLIIELKKVDSTNLYVARNWKKLPHLTFVIADYQTNGKGAGNNKWHSLPNQNLLISILIKKNMPIQFQYNTLKITALSIIDLLKNYKLKPFIKWPNDILINKQKIAGILIENKIRNNIIEYTIVGIGLNINQTEFQQSLNATSLKKITGKTFDVYAQLLKLKNIFIKRLNNDKNLTAEYLNNLYGYRKTLSFRQKDFIFNAKIEGIDQYGRLLLNIDGQTKTFNFKEIEFVL